MDYLKYIDLKLDEISKKLSFNAINPVNAEEEKERFFSKRFYNPQFQYAPYRSSINALAEVLKNIRPDDSVMGRLFEHTRLNYLTHIGMIKARGTDEFTYQSRKLYGSPDSFLGMNADVLVKLKIPEGRKEKPLTSDQVEKKLRFAFMNYGFDWKVAQKDMIACAAVKTSKKMLYIKKDSRFDSQFVKRLIVHEIGTHVVRFENGRSQPYKLFSRGFPGYLMTEEGLAVVNEERNCCLNNALLKTYAGRVLAIRKALESSFYDTYRYMRRYFSKEAAWRLTLRAKRGLGDTAEPGALTKDMLYLKGYLKVKEYIRRRGSLTSLYYGKLGIEHVNELKDISGTINPGVLPMFRYTKYFMGHFSELFRNLIFLANDKEEIKEEQARA
jgi:uncharacterized protein (TIGR02421 family)